MTDHIKQVVDSVVMASANAFKQFRTANVRERAELMRSIADHIEKLGEELIETANRETHLPAGRLNNEKNRTVNQWRLYAAAIETGVVLDLRIDSPKAADAVASTDIRKMMAGMGPVVIFGSSNFPFAFSTAGGDAASAIAAGNSVIVKTHPGHPDTSRLMTDAIKKAIADAGYPDGLFAEIDGGLEVGQALVLHEQVKAVGFTGSFAGGKALFDLASKRPTPIPLFAEMGSINPVFLLPQKLAHYTPELASQYIGSLTLGTGQFCTNPGVLVAVRGQNLDRFISDASEELKKKPAEKMLHPGIATSYRAGAAAMGEHEGIEILSRGAEGDEFSGQAILAKTSSTHFLNDKHFCGEVFGPFGLIVECESADEMKQIAVSLEGQLTATFLAEEAELKNHEDLIAEVREKCGRIIFNNFPTGVEVCFSMHHGGPFPATTDSRFTSVGADAIKRFMRPVSYQNWPQALLPDELKNANPLGIVRTVNGTFSHHPINQP